MTENYWNEAKGFVDIGSGFGRVVFYFGFLTNLQCFGYEIVPVRIQFA